LPNLPASILVSAGEASGDYYAAELVKHLRERWPDCHFFGCAGPKLRAAGVEPVVRTEDLAVVGLVEVIRHLPRIWLRYRRLVREAARRKPALAILTDSPDFHFRVAAGLKKSEIPVVYLIAPQVWAWRQGRVKSMRRIIDLLLCIFPFEEAFFRQRGVPVRYIGHPLASRVKPGVSREAFFKKHDIPLDRPLVAVLPGSRRSEAMRHIPELRKAADLLAQKGDASFLLPASSTCGSAFFKGPLAGSRIRAIEGEAWETMAHCDVALAASGTVTVEAALLGAPMVTFYRVSDLSWAVGKLLVKSPFYTMVNLIAGRRIVPELMQSEMTGERIAENAERLLSDSKERAKMKAELESVALRLAQEADPMETAADEVVRVYERQVRGQ